MSTHFGRMELVITIDDAKAYVKPWTTRANLRLLADTELLESFCEGHDRTMEHRRVGSPSAEPPSPPLR